MVMQQVMKGCEMAMHSAALLTKENHDLRAANKVKRKESDRDVECLPMKASIFKKLGVLSRQG
jgi:hypothetical protein